MILRPVIAILASKGMRGSCGMSPVALAAELSAAPRASRPGLAAVWQQQDSHKHHFSQHRCHAAATGAAYRSSDRYAALRGRPAGGALPPLPPEVEHAADPSSSGGGSGAIRRRLSSPLGSRSWLASQLPYENYKVVGVSFEDRQPAIAALHPHQPLVLAHEPDNPHDPNAVAVTTLASTSLGYIPREQTHHFLLDRCFGFVASVGKAAAEEPGAPERWGFRIQVQPTLPPVEVLGLPPGLLPHASLAAQLSDDPAWQRLAAQTLSATEGHCEATGSQGAVAAERWVLDEAACVLRLAGLRPLHPEVLQLEQAMLAGAHDAAQQAAAEQLAGFNFWPEADAVAYVADTAARQAARDGRDWRLDLRLLQREGVVLPAGLEALAI